MTRQSQRTRALAGCGSDRPARSQSMNPEVDESALLIDHRGQDEPRRGSPRQAEAATTETYHTAPTHVTAASANSLLPRNALALQSTLRNDLPDNHDLVGSKVASRGCTPSALTRAVSVRRERSWTRKSE